VPAGIDHGRGSEPTNLVRRIITSEKDEALIRARAAGLTVLEGRYVVEKYQGEVAPENLYEIVESAPNLFLTAGITEVLKLATGAAATAFNASNARLCVGDGTTAAAAGQTDLVGTNKFRQLVDTAPTVSTNTVTFVATFAGPNANYAWAEIAVANAASGGAMWSRTVPAGTMGTKAAGTVWVLNWSLTVS
jgi:hypothetical protein